MIGLPNDIQWGKAFYGIAYIYVLCRLLMSQMFSKLCIYLLTHGLSHDSPGLSKFKCDFIR